MKLQSVLSETDANSKLQSKIKIDTEYYEMDNAEENLLKLREENEALRNELAAFRENGKMFHALVETAVGNIGEEFFNTIIEKLSEWLKAECVIIGQLIGENTVQGSPTYLDGEIIHDFTYHLKNTPCDLTKKKGYCVYPDEVGKHFPLSKDIKSMDAKGYVGIALYNKKGEANGILCALSRKKLQLPPQAEDILRIVGARVTSEIERIKAQKALELSEASLKKANASKDRLFSIISHDLTSPFNALIGFSDRIVHRVEQGNYTDLDTFAKIISDTSHQTYGLLENLLDWSLSQTGNIAFKPEPVQLSKLVKKIIALKRQLANEKQITIDTFVDEGLFVFADTKMLGTILRNLLANAIKFTHSKGNIEITAQENEQTTIISISDTGQGIEPSKLTVLFDNGHNASEKGTENEPGTGLGLIICKEFIDIHHGEIWAESEINIGSRFYISLPKEN